MNVFESKNYLELHPPPREANNSRAAEASNKEVEGYIDVEATHPVSEK